MGWPLRVWRAGHRYHQRPRPYIEASLARVTQHDRSGAWIQPLDLDAYRVGLHNQFARRIRHGYTFYSCSKIDREGKGSER